MNGRDYKPGRKRPEPVCISLADLTPALLPFAQAPDLNVRSDATNALQEMPVSSAKAADSPLPTGRLLTYSDITPQLKGRQAEVGCTHCLLQSFRGFLGSLGRLASAPPAACWQPSDLGQLLKICHAMQLFWPDDKMWYLVEIHSIIPKNRMAK